MSESPVIVWFRQDLRLDDNPALAAAVDSGRPILPVYILDDGTPGARQPGGASCWWLHQSLCALAHEIADRGASLLLRRGAPGDVLTSLVDRSGAAGVYWNRVYEPEAVARDRRIKERLKDAGVEVESFNGALLWEPWEIETGSGTPFRVFTPFSKACLGAREPGEPHHAPERLEAASNQPEGQALDDWKLLPVKPDWAGGLRERWTPGETGARERAAAFLDDSLESYAENRDIPAAAETSRLSPHLHFGEISVRRLWHAIDRRTRGGEAFGRELLWREFSHHLLYHNPELPDSPLRTEFTAFPWRDDPDGLAAWQKGQTGIPLVDAGMRELWQTGWMHNRVRMIAASYLVKNLLVPWQQGAAWFQDTLVDADLANNSASWQWVAGCGADAAPWFRIFNPVTQGERFDPDGTYVRTYVPEVRELPDAHIHAPWQAPTDVLEKASVQLGETYPEPVAEPKSSRRRALEAYETIRKN